MSDKQQIPSVESIPLIYQEKHSSPWEYAKQLAKLYAKEVIEYTLSIAAEKAVASPVGHSGEPLEGVTAHVWPLSILSLQDQIIKDLKL